MSTPATDDVLEWAIGLMSGTSMDAVDGVLAGFSDDHQVRVHDTCSRAYPDVLHTHLLEISTTTRPVGLSELVALDAAVGDVFADTASFLTARARASGLNVHVIGSHGQTLFHDPAGSHESLQIGDANRIAARTGLPTVADFRRRDMAEGGQGAPLVPAFHHALFARSSETQCIANIGGIANVTLLPDTAAEHVSGFDTGPGNALMDEWAVRHLGTPFDHDGTWGASGTLQHKLLDVLLADPWFSMAPPKSTGRDQFSLAWVLRRYPNLDALAPADVQRTFCELTAQTIALAARDARRLLVCGGGVRNNALMQRLQSHFAGPIQSTSVRGVDPQWVEATAFAWLALRRLHDLPGNLPSVTGARRSAVLGAIYSG